MTKQTGLLKHLPGLIPGTLVLALSAIVNPLNHYFSALMLVVCAIFLYFYIAAVPAQRNWWDIRAVFSAIWLFTIGLAALRLTDYQRPWEKNTWLILALAYAMFYIGATIGIRFGGTFHSWVTKKRGFSLCKCTLQLQKDRLFWICFGVTLFGISCFAINVAIRGYIPYFARVGDTYLGFYTKFYLFAVATTMVSGLDYYTLKTQKLSLWKKIFLLFSIIYSTFLFPMLVVSRGVFLTAALALTTAVFYLNKKRFILLVLSAVVIVAFYMEGTKARGYSEQQLNSFFEPSVIVLNGNNNPENTTETDSSNATEEDEPSNSTDGDGATDGDRPSDATDGDRPNDATEENDPNNKNDNNNSQKHFQLSGSAVFIYSYLTVSHDNFNEAVRLTENFTYGIRQLAPFNVLLRIDSLNQALSEGEYHLVRPHLNTVNLVGNAYYDLGALGVALFIFIWAFAFGVIQAFALRGNGPFALMALGNTMTPVTLCCFASWMSLFSHWMHWGFALILFLIASIKRVNKPSVPQ